MQVKGLFSLVFSASSPVSATPSLQTTAKSALSAMVFRIFAAILGSSATVPLFSAAESSYSAAEFYFFTAEFYFFTIEYLFSTAEFHFLTAELPFSMAKPPFSGVGISDFHKGVLVFPYLKDASPKISLASSTVCPESKIKLPALAGAGSECVRRCG